MKVHTESVQFKADQKLLDLIDKKVARLSTYFDRIQDAEVTLRLENAGQVKDKVAEIRLHVPGHSLFAKETNKTFEQSLNKAVGQLRRQLTRFKERGRERAEA